MMKLQIIDLRATSWVEMMTYHDSFWIPSLQGRERVGRWDPGSVTQRC